MPGRSRVRVEVDTSLCRRCQTNEPVLTVRTEPLCRICFVKYVSTKIVKRMESFRVRNSDPDHQRILLVPLSFGPCSIALLHVLSQHRQSQVERTGRPGYRLHVLYVATLDSQSSEEHLRAIKDRYPEHVYSTFGLLDAIGPDDLQAIASLDIATDEETDLPALLMKLKSTTSRVDVSQILLRKAITTFARANDCEAILWGDSTTRLAERTLAETAKGRGYSLPWIMADGPSFHELPYYFPVKDLLSKELKEFATMTEPPLLNIIVADDAKPFISTKNTTIDDLMKQYFESVERDFPSIVANVVKTTGKLQPIPVCEAGESCELCELPLDGAAPEKSRLCYGCIRTLSREVV
nr:cytoplasmic trna 2-thiolation protein 2 [Quercus suber]